MRGDEAAKAEVLVFEIMALQLEDLHWGSHWVLALGIWFVQSALCSSPNLDICIETNK